ncbi:MAG: hypothetical protein HY398_01170 [Candidatus Doudnabacteria bacterium]|nr:hypothetical protein [Candidatus Doudnabacteria bacterium]
MDTVATIVRPVHEQANLVDIEEKPPPVQSSTTVVWILTERDKAFLHVC